MLPRTPWLWLLTLPLLGCSSTGNAPSPDRGLAQEALTYHYDRDEGSLTVSVSGEVFTTYYGLGRPKPYFFPLHAPGGLPVTRAYPLGEAEGEQADHPHHTSVWFAHGDVDGEDFWHGSEDAAHMQMRTFRLHEDRGVVESSQYWRVGERILATDHREISFGATATTRWIDFDITIDPEGKTVRLGDTKEGSFALRLAPTLRVEGKVAKGSLLDSEGRVDGEVWGKRARWVAARGPVPSETNTNGRGVDVTVAIFDHPDNPRFPTWWHARKYGLLAANPFGQHDFEGGPRGAGDLLISEPVTFRYRIFIGSGARSAQSLDTAWSLWADQ